MLRFAKQLVVIVLFILIAGCSGGGCASGCSCGGVTPLAEGFDVERRIENAASVRITDAGLGFLSDNIGALASQVLGDSILTFDIPSTTISVGLGDVNVCPNGAIPPQCVAEIDVGGLDLTSQNNYGLKSGSPHNLVIEGELPLRIEDLLLDTPFGNVNATITGNNECPGGNPTFANVYLRVEMSLEIDQDPTHSRYGYTRIRVQDVQISNNDIDDALRFCGSGIGGGLLALLLNAIQGLLIDFIVDPLIGTVQEQIDDQLCQQANPDLEPPCPTGTQNVDGVCRYGNDPNAECASIILGLDGNIDIGGLLASISPGAKGGFDFLLAAGGDSIRDDSSGYHWGDLNPIGNGVSLGMYGGTEPTPITGCVPLADVALPTGIGFPDELLANDLPDWPMGDQPHFGLGLNERFVNYMLAQTYNSGALCLGITADALGDGVPLNTALVGVLAASMKELGRQQQAAPLAIVLRPQTPPEVAFGNGTDLQTDPNVRLTLNQLALDFYVWSLDRYIRALTTTLDLDIPVNIVVTPEGLQPVIEDIGVTNAVVTNSQLLREDPATIAAALQDLLGGLVGGLLGDALPPIDISSQLSSLGIVLNIPPSVEGQGSPGLRRLIKGSDNYLGIFASFGIATSMMDMAGPPISETSAQLTRFEVDPEGLRLATYKRDNGPKATLHVGSSLDDGSRQIEWQYKLDSGPWHPFTTRRELLVDDPTLRAEGRHIVYVRSRVVGQVHSLDPEPAEIELLVDVQPPEIMVKREDDGLIAVQAEDLVSGRNTKLRVRLGHETADGDIAFNAWSEWHVGDDIVRFDPGDADELEVEALDEEGHLATVSQALRGRAEASGCECTVASDAALTAPKRGAPWLLAALLGLAGLWRRRRSARLSGARRRAASAVRQRGAASAKVLGAAAVMLAVGSLSGCSCGGDGDQPLPGCRNSGTCQVLAPGLVGAYGSAAVAPDGTVWVAGYLEANWEDAFTFGDLVVGRYDGDRVLWEVVDGYDPEEVVDAETFDPQGFRGGRVEPGADVGLWTSIGIDGAGQPAVAYYDATLRALRYAHFNGESWDTTIVQQTTGGDVGRYAKLVMVSGVPNIVYQFSERGDDGAITSGVRLARGSTAAADTSWGFEDVASNPATPCRAYLCSSGSACVASNGLCSETSSDCDPACDGAECVLVDGAPSCEAVFDSNKIDTYPDAVGLYISAAERSDGTLGIAYYDRINGDVVVATRDGSTWTNVIADGDAGDVGIGTSLAIDPQGNFHLAYVDGLDEALKYTMVESGTTPGPVEVVDDGLGHPDGHHLVGDDSHIFVTQGGEIRVSYQDATNGTLRYAVGTPAGGAHNWTSKAVSQEDFAGFFSTQVEIDGQLQVVNWWRRATPSARGDVRVLTP